MRWPARRVGTTRNFGAAVCAAVVLHGSPAGAQQLPQRLSEPTANLRESGSGLLRYWGFQIYHAKLWVSGERYNPDTPFALGMRYVRAFTGEAIAQSSTDEIRRLGLASDAQLANWDRAMRRLFPDIKAGDELLGKNWPQRGVEFFLNGQSIGSIDDPAFARAFFAIWLDPRTRATDLRAALLGGTR